MQKTQAPILQKCRHLHKHPYKHPYKHPSKHRPITGRGLDRCFADALSDTVETSPDAQGFNEMILVCQCMVGLVGVNVGRLSKSDTVGTLHRRGGRLNHRGRSWR